MNADFDDTAIGVKRPEIRSTTLDLDDTVLPQSRSTTGTESEELTTSSIADPDTQPPKSYAIRVGRQDTVVLDAITYVGRRPSTPRVFTGGVPHLVQVSSRLGQVSATHVELRQLGSTVVVTDMRSTNGTVVAVPGQTPRTLRQGESAVVTPGTLVDIGENNVIEILPLQDQR